MTPDKTALIKEFAFKTSRSGGKGGQHVNKVSSKVELIFNISNSAQYSDEEKLLLQTKLAAKLDIEGNLHVVSQEDRSQLLNKANAIEKAVKLLTKALIVQKKRKATKVPKSAVQKRLESKSVRSVKKESRRKPELE